MIGWLLLLQKVWKPPNTSILKQPAAASNQMNVILQKVGKLSQHKQKVVACSWRDVTLQIVWKLLKTQEIKGNGRRTCFVLKIIKLQLHKTVFCQRWPRNSHTKYPAYGRHWLSRRVLIIVLWQKTKLFVGTIWNRTRGGSTHLIQNTSQFLRLHAGTTWNRTRGQSTRPVQNTFLF